MKIRNIFALVLALAAASVGLAQPAPVGGLPYTIQQPLTGGQILVYSATLNSWTNQSVSSTIPTNLTGITSITAPASTDLTLNAGSGNQNVNLNPTGTGNVNVNVAAGSFLNVGTGGTGTTNVGIVLNGTSGTAGGPYIAFEKGGVNSGYIGVDSAVVGGAGSGVSLYSASSQATKIYSGGLIALTLSSAQLATFAGGVVVGAPTLGGEGTGTINAQAIYVNGAAVGTGTGNVSTTGSPTTNGISYFTAGTTITSTGNATVSSGGLVTAGGGVTVSGSVFSVSGSTIGSSSAAWIGSNGSGGWFINVPTGDSLGVGIANSTVMGIATTGVSVTGVMTVGGNAVSTTGLLVENTVTGGAAEGIQSSPTLTASGNTQSVIGTYTIPTFAKSTFTGLVYYGERIDTPTVTGSGTIATAYELYLQPPPTATTAWGIYVLSGQSFFGGNVLSNGVYESANGTSSDAAFNNQSTSGSVNTGVYFPSNTTVAMSAGGTQSATFSSSGLTVNAGTITTAAGATAAAGAWNLGALRTNTALVPSTTQGLQVAVGGTLYTLAVLSTNP